MELYTSAKAIKAATLEFANNGRALQEEAHKLACSVLAHCAKHRDISVVRNFLDAMPEFSRANALRAWFAAFGPITFDGNRADFMKDGTLQLANAMAKPFWTFKAKEGEEYSPVDAGKLLESLIKKLEKDAKLTGRDHLETIQALKYVPVWKAPQPVQPLPTVTLIPAEAPAQEPTAH